MAGNARSRIRVLILEDNRDDADFMLGELKKAGFTPDWRVISSEADYLAELHQQPDLILADYTLPHFDAAKALRLLHERELDIPFIVVTGSVSEEAAVLCMKEGAADYLLKDRLSRLGPAVEHALNEQRLRHEHLRAEQALRESEEKFRTIFNESLDIILLVDSRSGYILNVNKTVERLLDYESDALIGKHFSILFPPEATRAVRDIEDEIRINGAVFEAQKFRRAGGMVVPMDLTAALIPWENDRVILITLRDVTDRQHAEEALEAAEMLNIQLENEKELNELKTRFISMVSHEYRNPLTTILTSTEMLQRYNRRMNDDQRSEHYERIRQSVGVMIELLDQVLLISRFEAGRQEFKPRPLDLTTFCEKIIEEIRLNAGSAYQISFTTQGAARTIDADAKLLRQVLTNLLSNAVKYSPQGGSIQTTLTWEADRAALRITDSGIGIPAADKARLFQMFHRGSNVDGISGTGLGLSIARRAVEQHGGTITFESREGSGTTFIVTLPLSSGQ